MTEIKFLHTSDWQIGMTRWFLPPEAQARFDAARLAAIKRLGEVAVQHGCSFIVVAGDVFESNSLASQTTGRVREALRALPVPVYLLPGNHDPLTPDSIFYSSVLESDNLHVIGDSEVISVAEGVELVGAPLTSKTAVEDLVHRALSPLSPSQGIRIAVGHGQALGRSSEPTPDLIDLTFVESKLLDGTIHYLALGDTHSAQSVGQSGKVWFSGAPEVTDFHRIDSSAGENNSGNVLVVTANSSGAVSVEEIAVGTWRFESFLREINSRAEAEAFIAELDAYPNKAETAIKYAIVGSLDLSTIRYLEKELDRLVPVFAALFEWERLMDLRLDPDADDLANMNLVGYQRDALEELMVKSSMHVSDEANPASDAIRLLFRLAGEDK